MKNVLLIAIILLSAVFRLLWLDSLPAVVTNHEATLAVNAWREDLRLWWVGEEIVSPLPWLLGVVSLKILGLSTFALRLPVALAGTVSVYLLYLLGRRWFNENVALIAAGVMAISPWHVHLSRFFIEEVILLTAVLGLAWGLSERRKALLVVSALAVLLSSWHFLDRVRVALVDSVSIWFLNLFTYLSFDWLFFRGDKYFLHGIGDLGQLYTLLVPFFLSGLFVCWERKVGRLVLLLTILFVATASLSRFSPEARASLLAAPWIILITAVGADRSILWVRKRWQHTFPLIALGVCVIALYQIVSYVHFYMVHFGKRSGSEWSAVYKQVAPYIVEQYGTHDAIIVSNHYGAAREQLVFHAPKGSVLRERSASKIVYGVPDKLDRVPPGTLLFLEPEFNLKNAHRVREFKLVNNVPALIAWEIQ